MAEEEAARAFLELQVDGRVSGAAAVSWVAGHPRFAALSRPARAKAWSVADSNDSGALDDAQFATFVKELDDAATASDASTPVAAAAAAGLVVGGPPGAVVLGGLTACYQSLSRVGQSAFVGGLGGMLAAGPPGAVAGAVVGAGGQRVADESYLGDPRRWSQYADLATKGVEERTRGLDSKGVEFVDEGAWVKQRDARTGPALEVLLGERISGRIGICGSGGGLRAATALAGFLAEAHACGLLDATTYLSGVSGSCWTLSALYAEDAFDPRKFPEILRERVAKDLRAPHSAWLAGSVSAPDSFVFPRFAARCRDGHDVGIVDVWGAHLAATLLPPPAHGGFGLAAFRRKLVKGAAPLPLLTAVEPVKVGPEWSSKNCCERCGDSFSLANARHHCRACGASVCDACCPGFGSSTLAAALGRMRSTDVDFEGGVWCTSASSSLRESVTLLLAGRGRSTRI